MSSTNNPTIHAYDANIQAYRGATPTEPSPEVKAWIRHGLDGLPVGAHVLELGSGPGRDARYIESLGYRVTRTDATPGFVTLLRDEGFEAQLLNVISDDILPGMQLIFADAVLLHLTRPELAAALRKIRAALEPAGRVAFSLKEGQGEAWTSAKLGAPVYFCYWSAADITALLSDCGFDEITVGRVDGGPGRPHRLHINARVGR